jgi:hypothetical protein
MARTLANYTFIILLNQVIATDLRWKINGTVILRISQVCEQRGDAMINALFWDAA